MSSKKPSTIVDEHYLQNVELHRTESMPNQDPEKVVQLKTNPALNTKDTSMDSAWSKVRSCFSKIPPLTAETVLFLYMFSYTMRSTTSTTMIIQKVCQVHLGYPEDVCGQLKDHPIIKSEVMKMANNYGLGHTLLQMLPSSVMSLFIGSWSDKYGRKFPMILALSGIIVDGCGSSVCAYFLNSRVEYYYIPAVFMGCSGGFIGILAVLYSYASDTSTASNRTMKYAIMQVAFGISMPLGSLAGGWIFKFYSYVPVFAASACGHVLGLCCVIFCLKETRGLEISDDWITKFRSFWSLEGVKSSLRTTAKKRPDKGRKQIWLLILAMIFIILSFASLSSVTFLYVHHQFDWDNTTFSTISAIYMVIGFVLMMTIVPLSRRLNMADPALGIMGSVSILLKNVGTGLANKTWIYHIALVTGLLSSMAMLASRSRISKIIPKDDLGKVFAFVSTAESLLPIAATTVVSQVFNASLDFFPGLIFVIMGCLMITPVGVFIWVALLPAKKEGDQEQATEESSTTKL